MGYAHVARSVRLDSKGGLKFEESSKDVLGEGREVAEVITVSCVLQLLLLSLWAVLQRRALPAWHRCNSCDLLPTFLFHHMQDLASQAMDVAKGTKGLEEVVDAIREHEMQILNSLVSVCWGVWEAESCVAAADDVCD